MIAHRYTPVIPPTPPAEPEALADQYHADLAAITTSSMIGEESAIRRRGLASGRLTPHDLARLAACQARALREEGGR